MSMQPVVLAELAAERLPEHLGHAAAGYVEAGLHGAANTQAAYRHDWKDFTAWCETHGYQSLPASVAAIAGYLTELALAQRKVSTIRRRQAAITKAHRLAGHVSPANDEKVKTLLKGIIREQAQKAAFKQREAPAFTVEQLRTALYGPGLEPVRPSDRRALRDRALLLVGFAGAFRRDELRQLNVDDITPARDGRSLLVTIRFSKTDQEGAGATKALFMASDPDLCPVRALQAWLGVLARTTGPVFVSMRKADKLTCRRLSNQHINLLVRRYFPPQYLPTSDADAAPDGSPKQAAVIYTAHSLRASFVTVAKANGAEDTQVMNQTHHKSEAMIRRYTRRQDALDQNAGSQLGL